jgi:hypothetical protein
MQVLAVADLGHGPGWIAMIFSSCMQQNRSNDPPIHVLDHGKEDRMKEA